MPLPPLSQLKDVKIWLVLGGGLIALGMLMLLSGLQNGAPSEAPSGRGSSNGWGSGEPWAGPAEEPCRQAVRAKAHSIENIQWTQAFTFTKDKDGPIAKVQLNGTGTISMQIYANRDPVHVPVQVRCEYFPETHKACSVNQNESELEACRDLE